MKNGEGCAVSSDSILLEDQIHTRILDLVFLEYSGTRCDSYIAQKYYLLFILFFKLHLKTRLKRIWRRVLTHAKLQTIYLLFLGNWFHNAKFKQSEICNQDQFLDGKLLKPGYGSICLHQF